MDRPQAPSEASQRPSPHPWSMHWPLITLVVLAFLGAIYVAEAVIAPFAFALFLIALVWPLQARLQAHIPRLVALAVSILLLVVAFSGFALLIVWAFGRVARWIFGNLSRFQEIYNQMSLWLEERGVAVASIWADYFNIGWLVGLTQKLTSQVNTTLTFWLVILVYVILGLLEVEATARKVEALPNRRIAQVLLAGSAETAVKIRRYMVVRSLMSLLTGALVWAFAAVRISPSFAPASTTILPRSLPFTWIGTSIVFDASFASS